MEKRKMPWLIYAIAVWLKPLLHLAARYRYEGAEKLPAGGYVLAPNHLSWIDPFTVALFLFDRRIPPRYLAKASLFDLPIGGWILRQTGQIPVYRATERASEAMRAAVTAVSEGKAIVVYPEGTMTRDPEYWPMSGRTGAVRIALETGKPLIPMAQWGPQEIWRPYSPFSSIRIFPRRTVYVKIGDPVDLSPWQGLPITTEVLEQASARLMSDVTDLLVQIRGEKPGRPPLDAKSIIAAEAIEREQRRAQRQRRGES